MDLALLQPEPYLCESCLQELLEPLGRDWPRRDLVRNRHHRRGLGARYARCFIQHSFPFPRRKRLSGCGRCGYTLSAFLGRHVCFRVLLLIFMICSGVWTELGQYRALLPGRPYRRFLHGSNCSSLATCAIRAIYCISVYPDRARGFCFSRLLVNPANQRLRCAGPNCKQWQPTRTKEKSGCRHAKPATTPGRINGD